MIRARPAALALLAAAALATGAAAQTGKPDPAPPAGAGAQAAPSGKPDPEPSGKPAPAAPGGSAAAPAAPGDARALARDIMQRGFIEGFFQTFWGSFRGSFIDSLAGRGHDRAAVERLADNTVLPVFQRARPALEARILDVLSTALTTDQLQGILAQARAGSAEGVRAGVSPAEPALQSAIRAWTDEVLEANRTEITQGMQREGLRR